MRLTKEKAKALATCAANGWTKEQFADAFDEKRSINHEEKDFQALDNFGDSQRHRRVRRSHAAQ